MKYIVEIHYDTYTFKEDERMKALYFAELAEDHADEPTTVKIEVTEDERK